MTTQKHLLQIFQLTALPDNQWRHMEETSLLRFLVRIGAIERTIKRVNSADDIEYYYRRIPDPQLKTIMPIQRDIKPVLEC
jgi:hypothetical protein